MPVSGRAPSHSRICKHNGASQMSDVYVSRQKWSVSTICRGACGARPASVVRLGRQVIPAAECWASCPATVAAETMCDVHISISSDLGGGGRGLIETSLVK
eukprot:46915-Eustigmatos_ZCMA.PRE.1